MRAENEPIDPSLGKVSRKRRSEDDDGDTEMGPITMKLALKVAMKSAQKRATQRGLPFELDLGFLMALAYGQEWRCAVSSLPFVLNTAIGGQVGREPYRPSIDRIDRRLGYTRGNVRLTCVAVNFAIGAWGDAVFNKIVAGVVRRQENARRTRVENANGPNLPVVRKTFGRGKKASDLNMEENGVR